MSLWGKVGVALAFVLSILGLALKLIAKGIALNKAEVAKAGRGMKIKINEAVRKQKKATDETIEDEHEKAKNGDFSGLNDLPHGMRHRNKPKT